ncbi:hypothetical protein Lalb_Chr24g0395501 [Lupinus albus]|uniref:Uncharacterized protein n=1 Tax=Lupinus albus TaxID=3870 RepID=A0A6A4MYJ5_LUPAL|nr:hypothetical protein Lalb_Chr24g0395501 [Lupinus albus]
MKFPLSTSSSARMVFLPSLIGISCLAFVPSTGGTTLGFSFTASPLESSIIASDSSCFLSTAPFSFSTSVGGADSDFSVTTASEGSPATFSVDSATDAASCVLASSPP